MIELEKTYLIKYLPSWWEKCVYKEILDIYIPKENEHSKLRIRKNGNKYEITKKELVNENDASCQKEFTIPLKEEEFNVLKTVDGKIVRKIRYMYTYEGKNAEIDIFQDELKWLILIDFEFDSIEEKDNFQMPDFCLVDVTQEDFIAGWMLCGKKYRDIEKKLEKYKYKKI